ncbi:MAG: hypothetical protein NC548_35660 [Lachnospiraceae bacterium]|nr:hypothetical protein [Lachnospiraceae bacterium]
MINLKNATAQETASYFTCKVNNYSFNPKETAEKLRHSELMKDLDLCWIKTLSSPAYRTDGRNEIAAGKGRELSEIPFVRKKLELAHDHKMEEVAQRMAMEHRTLQQTFSKLIFYHFMITCSEKDSEELAAVMGDSFYLMPLI